MHPSNNSHHTLIVDRHQQSNPHHDLIVIRSTCPAYSVLNISVSGNRDTLPETLKKHLLEEIQNWAGPQGYRFYPSKGIQVLPQGMNNLTVLANGAMFTHCFHPFPTIHSDFYLDHLNPQDIHGLRIVELNNPQQRYDFGIFADDKSPPEMLDGILQDILNVFKA